MRLVIFCSFILLLCTCDRAQKMAGPSVLSGTLRYQADRQQLEATVKIRPLDTLPNAPAPTLFGSAMAPFVAAGEGVFRATRSLPPPTNIQLTSPCPSGDCPVDLSFTPPFIDSLPAILSRSTTNAFAVTSGGMRANESLLVFFEPADRSEPKRIQLIGPTSTGALTLPAKVMADVPAGDYEVYLIKQQLAQDSTAQFSYQLQTEYFTRSRSVTVTE